MTLPDHPPAAASATPREPESHAELIRRAYLSFLGRSVDPAGMETYHAALASGALTPAALVDLLVASTEFQAGRTGSPEERGLVNALVKFHTRLVVRDGPFRGMAMLDLSNRGDGDIAPKLLGTYEQELHPFIERLSAGRYDAIVDIGCAEGYFAVGLARMFPGTPVLAYDVDRTALDILDLLAERNDCRERIVKGEFCDPAELTRVLERYPRALVIADCEGYEKTLFGDPAIGRAGRQADLIIECHDLWDDRITPTITGALAATHDITIVPAAGRNPNLYDFLAHLNDWDRFRAVWERRGARQNWLVCEPRRGGMVDRPVSAP